MMAGIISIMACPITVRADIAGDDPETAREETLQSVAAESPEDTLQTAAEGDTEGEVSVSEAADSDDHYTADAAGDPVSSEDDTSLAEGSGADEGSQTDAGRTPDAGGAAGEDVRDLADEDFLDLSPGDMEKKRDLADDLRLVTEGERGEDYEKDTLVCHCDSEEEAAEIAAAYAGAADVRVSVESFAYGVAVLKISEYEDAEPAVVNGESIELDEDPVQGLVEIAAQEEVSLPAVYPETSIELCSINPDHEIANGSFDDPYLTNYKGAGTGAGTEYYEWYHDAISSKFLWKAEESGGFADPADVVVAVIDSGILASHEDFSGVSIVGARSIIGGVETDDVTDHNGHGTNVAGIIAAAADNGRGGRGVATRVKAGEASSVGIMPVKVTDGNSLKSSDVVRAINYVIEQKGSGINVAAINLSLGGSHPTSSYDAPVANALEAGITVCAAAGNNGRDETFYPADAEGVIKVGSVNSSLERSAFSNYGERVDIAAPGGDNASGSGNEYLYAPAFSSDSAYGGKRGTSQATPVVAAAAALIMANEPELSPQGVLNRLKETASPIDSGYQLGAGVVNIAAALGADDSVPEPVIENSEYKNGVLTFDISGGNPDGVICYTIDGTTPDPDNVSDTDINEDKKGTRICQGTVSYNAPDASGGVLDVTIKALTVLYSKTGPVASSDLHFLEKKVTSVTLSGRDDIHELSIGATLQLTAGVLPLSAINRTVTYKSSDPSRASVDKNGKVTARNYCKTDSDGNIVPVVITAAAADDSGCHDTYEIFVKPRATNLTVKAPLQTDTTENGRILLSMSENPATYTYSLSDNYVIYPSAASQRVIYASSNKKILTVDAGGLVTAHATGSATVTVTAADGSGVKDTVSFIVKTPMYSLEIGPASGESRIAATKKFTPASVMNGGDSTPDVKKLKWSITEGAEYAAINATTGVVTARKNDDIGYAEKTVKIMAVSEQYGIASNELAVQIVPVTESITVTEHPEIVCGNTVSVFDYLSISPARTSTMNSYEHESSNTKIIQVSENGAMYAVKAGTAKVTVKALDGSAKSAVLKITVVPDITGISITNKNTDSIEVITPGKKLSFTAAASDGTALDSRYVEWSGGSVYTQVSSGKMSYTADSAMTQRLREQYKYSGDSSVVKEQIKAEYTPNGKNTSVSIYVYPDRVNSIYFPADKNPKIKEGTLCLTDIGVYTKIYPDTLPDKTSFNRKFKYTSANTKVVTVSDSGFVTPVENGKTYITVKALDGSNKTVKLPVTVSRPAKAVKLAPKTAGAATLTPGRSLQFEASAYADRTYSHPAGDSRVTYSISTDETDEDGNVISLDGIASITSQGKLTVAKKADLLRGLRITVTAASVADSSVTASCDVTLQPAVTAITLTSDEAPDVGSKKAVTVGTEEVSEDDGGNTTVLLRDSVNIRVNSTIGNGTSSPSGVVHNYRLTVKNDKLADAAFTVSSDRAADTKLSSDKRTISSSDIPEFTVTARASGKTVITVESLDGSGKKVSITVICVVPVKSVAAVSPLDIYELDAGKKLQLSALLNMSHEDYEKSAESGTSKAAAYIKNINKLCTNQKVSWYFSDEHGEQISTVSDYATLNVSTGLITAKKVGYDPRTVWIVARSADMAGAVSDPVKITINPSLGYVTSLSVKTKTDIYDLGYGSSLSMVALLNDNAADKKVVWSACLVDASGNAADSVNGRTVEDVIDTAALIKKGTLKSRISNNVYTVRITAASVGISDADGSHLSDSCDISLYPKIYDIKIRTSPTENVKEILSGTDIVLTADGYGYDRLKTPSSDWKPVCDKYRVTYSGGCARVYLLNVSGNEVRVEGYKKGTATVTFTALDGSGSKASYKLKVTEPRADEQGLTTVDGRRYYVEDGAVYTGFKVIDGKLLYFNENEKSKGTMIESGFFTLPASSDYYREGDSNRYFALSGGEVWTEKGWATIKHDPSVSDTQEWSYYFSYPGIDSDEDPVVIYEDDQVRIPLVSVVCGDVTIDGNGVLERDAHLTSDNSDIFYLLDDTTGARKRAVVYFYGNYHGHAIAEEQIDTIDSLAKYINTDEKMDEAAPDMVYANSEDTAEIQRLYDMGLTSYDPDITVATGHDGSIYPEGTSYARGTVFPRAASSYISGQAGYSEKNLQDIAAGAKLSKHVYREEDDIAAASGDTYALVSDGAQKDGNLDVYDEQAYSYDIYQRAIAKYGPNNLVLAGASSGGGTCLALVKMARDNGLPQPDALILYSPWLDAASDNEEEEELIQNVLLSEGYADLPTLRYWGARYTREESYTETDDGGNTVRPYEDCAGPGWDYDFASPINYSRYKAGNASGTLAGIESDIYIYTGTYDFCLPDCKVADILAKAAGVSLTSEIYTKAPHGYMFSGSRYYKETKKTMLDSARVIMTQKGAITLN